MHRLSVRIFVMLCAGVLSFGCAAPPVDIGRVHATVLTPDGNPAAGALAVLVPSGHWAWIKNGRTIDQDPTLQRCAAGSDGAVSFPGMAGPFQLVAIDPSGYGRIDKETLLQQPRVQLQPWARVDGLFMVGKRPGEKMDMLASASEEHEDNPELPHVNAVSEATTDAAGKFTFDRIPAGEIEVGHEFQLTFQGAAYAAGTAEKRIVRAAPGQRVVVTFGGTGRPITGSVIIPEELSKRHDWEFTYAVIAAETRKPSLPMPADVKESSLSAQQRWYEQFIATPAGKEYLADQTKQYSGQRYLVDIAHDGTFRADDIPAGSYSISFEVRGPSDDPSVHHGMVIAAGDSKFNVPDIPGGRSAEPIRIPAIDLVTQHHVHVPDIGDAAPEIISETLDGKPLKLADYRGKFVLLEFWATWCGPCRGEVPDLKGMYDRYGKNGSLVMVGLSIDDMRFAPKKFVDDHGINWTQCFVGSDGQAVIDYGVDQYGVPSMWLIGPGGRVIARPVPGENTEQLWHKISAAVSAALGK